MLSKSWYLILILLGADMAFADNARVLWFTEQEKGTKPYPVRFIVTDRYLRTDDGTSRDGFVLLDRREKTVYNVLPSSRSILVIEGKSGVGDPPDGLEIEERQAQDPKAPKIGDLPALEIQVFANDKLCYSSFVVPGLDDEVSKAMREFYQVLAARQLVALDATPPEYRDFCFMTRYIYAPARHLAHGIPLQEWDQYGRSRILAKPGETVEVSSDMFVLPASYRRY